MKPRTFAILALAFMAVVTLLCRLPATQGERTQEGVRASMEK